MKTGALISWRTGRQGFGAWHVLASVEPLKTVCGQLIPERSLVSIGERMPERPADACEKCLPVPTPASVA